MSVAVGQFAVGPSWEKNAETCALLMSQAAGEGVSLLILPEALLVRDNLDPDLPVKPAQLLEGGSLTRLLQESAQNEITTVLTIHVPSVPDRAFNMLVTLRASQVVAHCAKLHLYDTFPVQESRNVDTGNAMAPLLDVGRLKVELMTCYGLRFPELALAHALQRAEALILSATWVRESLKEHHRATLLAARALDTTCYLIAVGEYGNKNIGQNRVIDPLGVTIVAATETPTLIMAEASAERVRQVRVQLPVLSSRRFAPPQLL